MNADNQKNIVEYVVIMVGEFAKRHLLTISQAYKYLRWHKGINFLEDHYDIAHTLPMDDVVEDLTIFCKRQGGHLA